MSTVSRMYTSVRGLQTAIKDVGRLREIVGVLIRHGFGALVTRLSLEEVVGVKGLMAYRDEDDVPFSLAQRVRMSVEELGPTFIKLGQILSTRGDLIPADILAELQHLQDDVPELTYEAVAAQIEAELGAPIDAFFSEFDEAPLACASIAQVHRAVLRDEAAPVVVKVQRPDITPGIDADLNILDFLARRAELMVPELKLMDPVGIAHEFDRALRKELDFRNERAHILRFQENFDDFEGVRIPRVYERVSSSRVLVMEFMSGVKITRAPEVLDIDPYTVAPRMLRALFKMIFEDGYFHGDLHPGNILVEEDGTIALIDFGLIGRLTDAQRDNILDILVGLSREDYEPVARVFFDVGVKVPGVRYDYAAFERDVIEVMQKHIEGKTLHDIDVGGYFTDLVQGAIRHQIQMPPTYTMVFKALMTVEGIGKTLAPEINLVEEAQPFVREVLVERYSPRRLVKEGADTLGHLSRLLRQLPHTVSQLLRDAEAGQLQLQIDVRGLEAWMAEERAARERTARSIAFGGASLAGVLAADVGAPLFLGLPGLSLLFFAAAAWFGAPLVWPRGRGRG